MSPERFAMRLKQLREARGLTQEKLAKKAGISRAYLARLETGRHDPHLSRLRKLAKVLGVKVGRLVE
jgi:transcriptional regulator with XRE-family HTH domain